MPGSPAARATSTGPPESRVRGLRLLRSTCVTRILVMTTIPLADAKARLSAVLDEVRDTHERVVITRNGRPEAVIMAVSDLEALEETLDLLSTPGVLEQIRQAEADIAAGEAIDADELHRRLAARAERERRD
jgi:prevent-host-death family protein